MYSDIKPTRRWDQKTLDLHLVTATSNVLCIFTTSIFQLSIYIIAVYTALPLIRPNTDEHKYLYRGHLNKWNIQTK